MSLTYLQRVHAYAQRVVDGVEVAGKFERLASKRFFKDVARAGTPQFPYIINEKAGSRECQFLELLTHVKGEWAKVIYVDGKVTRGKLVLEDWQVFIEFNLFGWVHMHTGLRRFRRSYEEIARKNAKSTRLAGRALYMVFAENEPGAHGYSAATTAKQAREVFDPARMMVMHNEELQARFDITVGKHDITHEEDGSTFQVLNAEASTQDGLNVHFAAVDEVHAHKKRDLWDVIESADGSRSQPMISAITTAGKDMSGIGYELRGYTIKVLTGVHDDETWFGSIFTIDEGDDWQDERVWRKANPNLGISAKLDKLQDAARKAKTLLSARGNFLTKHLNVWTNAGTAWMDMEAWAKCADLAMRVEDFDGATGYSGLDLAQRNDFAAKVKVFERDGVWHVFTNLYYNEVALVENTNAQLKGWADQGYVSVNPGNLTDFDVIEADLIGDRERHLMEEVAFDPALSMYFAGKMIDKGLKMVEITQRSQFYTQVLLQVEALVLAGKLKHDGNPLMTWMISNLVVKVSKYNGLRLPTKERPENKIDGPMAMLMALGRALCGQAAENIDDFLNSPIYA